MIAADSRLQAAVAALCGENRHLVVRPATACTVEGRASARAGTAARQLRQLLSGATLLERASETVAARAGRSGHRRQQQPW